MLHTNVEHTKGNGGSYFYLYLFEDLAQGSFHVAIDHGSFLKDFLTTNGL